MKKKSIWAAAMLLGALAVPAATATPIETFNFTIFQFDNSDGLVSGSFSGTPEADGSIRLADLTNFEVIFLVDHPVANPLLREEVDAYILADLQVFTVQPGPDGSNSSLVFMAAANTGANLCVGSAAAFGACGLGGNFAAVATSAESTPQNPLFYESTQFANVTFVQPPPPMLGGNPVGIAPGAPMTGTPEPATTGLSGLALIAVGLWRRRACDTILPYVHLL